MFGKVKVSVADDNISITELNLAYTIENLEVSMQSGNLNGIVKIIRQFFTNLVMLTD